MRKGPGRPEALLERAYAQIDTRVSMALLKYMEGVREKARANLEGGRHMLYNDTKGSSESFYVVIADRQGVDTDEEIQCVNALAKWKEKHDGFFLDNMLTTWHARGGVERDRKKVRAAMATNSVNLMEWEKGKLRIKIEKGEEVEYVDTRRQMGPLKAEVELDPALRVAVSKAVREALNSVKHR